MWGPRQMLHAVPKVHDFVATGEETSWSRRVLMSSAATSALAAKRHEMSWDRTHRITKTTLNHFIRGIRPGLSRNDQLWRNGKSESIDKGRRSEPLSSCLFAFWEMWSGERYHPGPSRTQILGNACLAITAGADTKENYVNITNSKSSEGT